LAISPTWPSKPPEDHLDAGARLLIGLVRNHEQADNHQRDNAGGDQRHAAEKTDLCPFSHSGY
jgi:hypothetical protein